MSRRGTVQCINCRKQRRCLRVIVEIPAPMGSYDYDWSDNTYRKTTQWETEESLRIAICRPCLRSSFHLGSYLAEHAL